jgi:pantoate--beta-alanine ligase
MVQVVHTVADFRNAVQSWQQQGLKVAMVPTMGALHAGHLSLVTLAQNHVDKVVVSIFVNPKQFGPHEDYDAYPRTLDADVAALATVNGDLVYAPSVAEMYPDGFQTTVSVSELGNGLCGAARPGHFDGVCTVVSKLLLQGLPDIAVFGEKDYQQLAVIRRFVTDLHIPVRILGAPISREADGLARSSRNVYLSAAQRQQAPALYQALQELAQQIMAMPMADIAPLLATAAENITQAGFQRVDYLDVRDASSLQPLCKGRDGRPHIFAAAFMGTTRLIDNMPAYPYP